MHPVLTPKGEGVCQSWKRMQMLWPESCNKCKNSCDIDHTLDLLLDVDKGSDYMYLLHTQTIVEEKIWCILITCVRYAHIHSNRSVDVCTVYVVCRLCGQRPNNLGLSVHAHQIVM